MTEEEKTGEDERDLGPLARKLFVGAIDTWLEEIEKTPAAEVKAALLQLLRDIGAEKEPENE